MPASNALCTQIAITVGLLFVHINITLTNIAVYRDSYSFTHCILTSCFTHKSKLCNFKFVLSFTLNIWCLHFSVIIFLCVFYQPNNIYLKPDIENLLELAERMGFVEIWKDLTAMQDENVRKSKLKTVNISLSSKTQLRNKELKVLQYGREVLLQK